MSNAHFITPRVRSAVYAEFPTSAATALEILACAPVKEGSAAECIALGLLKMAKGDLERLKGCVAHFDARDALYAFSGVEGNGDASGKNLPNA